MLFQKRNDMLFHKRKHEKREKPEKPKSKPRQLIDRIGAYLAARPTLLVILLAFGVTFVNECLNRRSILAPFGFMLRRPLLFLCNVVIILVFEAFTLLFKRRHFLMGFISLLWVAMGITTFVMSFFRITPFNANDFILIKSVFPILPTYLTWPGLILCGIFLLSLLISLLVFGIRAKKNKVHYTRAAVTFLLSLAAAVIVIGVSHLSGQIPERFPSLHEAYRDYGFNFCFSVSVIDRGIDKPKTYDDDIDGIVSDVLESDPPSGAEDPEPESLPNIIFVQLESFCDMNLFDGFTFSEDPTPVFTDLKKSYPHGYLTVPSIGAGTANTEFEVLCGMSLKFFGMGEYPYQTILQTSTNESICFNLKEYGYTSHAIHNYKANFYDRNNVYAKLGFDTFTSMEYMNGLEYNHVGWAHDAVLVDYVTEALSSTEAHDLVYCVTVQGHGVYPTSSYSGEDEEEIRVTALPDGASSHAYTYFVNQLHETDAFIGALIASVKAMEEETIIVFFGDHLPNIGIEEDWVSEDLSLYETEYVIWHSEGAIVNEAAADSEALTSYQLSAKVMEMLGLNDGVMTHLHQKREQFDEKEYEVYLHMLQYDILYGDCNAYGGELPFEETDLQMGVHPIIITGAYPFGENSYIKGENFTKSSVIFVNGKKQDTEFLDSHTLILDGNRIDDGDEVEVIQIADGIFHIGSTDTFTYEE